MSLTTLVENNRLADRSLCILGKKGELVPRNADQLLALFHALGMSVEIRVQGNLAIVRSGTY